MEEQNINRCRVQNPKDIIRKAPKSHAFQSAWRSNNRSFSTNINVYVCIKYKSLPTKGIILIIHIESNFFRYKEWHLIAFLVICFNLSGLNMSFEYSLQNSILLYNFNFLFQIFYWYWFKKLYFSVWVFFKVCINIELF